MLEQFLAELEVDQKSQQAARTLRYPKLLYQYNHDGHQSANSHSAGSHNSSFRLRLQTDNVLGPTPEACRPSQERADVRHNAPALWLPAYGTQFLQDCCEMSIMRAIVCSEMTPTESTEFPTGLAIAICFHGQTGTTTKNKCLKFVSILNYD